MDSLSIAGLVLCLTVVVLSNAHALWYFFRRESRTRPIGCYRDEDGEATESSLQRFSDKWLRGSITGFSSIGLTCTAATAVIATVQRSDDAALLFVWSQFASWILSSLQAVILLTETSVTRRFTIAHLAFWTSTGLIALATLSEAFSSPQSIEILALPIATAGTATIRALCCLSISRRPDVYYEEKLVDQEYTVSIWRRLSFSYITSFVHFAGRNQGTMTVEDFPQLPYRTRSDHLHETIYQAHQQSRSLFTAICKVHFRALILQLILAIGSALLSFGPQLSLYGILKGLEDGSMGSPVVWAAVLGVTMFLAAALSSWLWWISLSQLCIPISSEIMALLYSKSMRRKDVQKAKQVVGDKEELLQMTREQEQQTTINLLTIDTKRLSEYTSFNHLIPSSIIQLLVACALFIRLIGWQSLLAGFLATASISPLNGFIAKRYMASQKAFMKATDSRTSVVQEVVKNIRQIKFSALEPAWKDRVLEARTVEFRLLFKACFYETALKAIWILSPLLLAAVSLVVYVLQNGHLEASIAFTTISIFGSLEGSLSSLPYLISTGLEAIVSIERIDNYLASPDKSTSQPNETDEIVFRDAAITWPIAESSEDPGFRLSGINVNFPPKGLGVVCGRTGSGKTLFLSSLLGECDIVSGSVQIPCGGQDLWKVPPTGQDDWIIDSAIAYVAQNPWTETGTIKENILFGLPFDQFRYQETLFASALERDLEVLQDGDHTDIGDNGINLSGGQRLRVSFARALYSRAGILILDDIFSALDADTAQHVYKHGLTGSLGRNRTRILATHHFSLCLPQMDYCVILEDGLTSYAGSTEEFRKMDKYAKFLRLSSMIEENHRDEHGSQSSSQRPSGPSLAMQDNQTFQKFSPEEQRATGSIPLKLYKKFIIGDKFPWMWILGVLAPLLYTILIMGRSWWLNVWTGQDHAKLPPHPSYALIAINRATQKVQMAEIPQELFMHIGVYVAISVAACVMGTLQFLFIRVACMRSSQALFKNLLSAVLAAPLRWVDTVPMGRVLNRFTSDMYTVDYSLGVYIGELLASAFQVCGVLIASITISPIVVVFAVILLAASLRFSVIYLAAAREAKRLESVSRTPILDQFTSSLTGLTTIRAFNQVNKYVQTMFARIDHYSKVSRALWLFNWWLQLRISILGAIFSTIIAVLVIKLGVSASLAGFAISFVLQYNTAVSTMIRQYASFEMDMNATERVIDYAGIETEPQDGLEPPAAWPTQGHMVVDNLVVSYSPELPPVLKGLTFTIQNNERIGVVGRTGSGKSTLALALFRFMEARQGQVFIDGLNTSKLNLNALRRNLTIVPQLPTLFTGTVRSNLDPFDRYSQTELLDALRRVDLISPDSKSNTTFLEVAVSESGANFSQGERQLLCLARAILQKSKIMILDEATSAVDMETDERIQHTIRSEFGRNMSSLLVIAHRLSTVADFDRILVMDDGEIVEFGAPRELIKKEEGAFRELVDQSGEKVLIKQIILG